MLLRIIAPHFVAGVVPGKAAAPIVRYMRGWSYDKIYCYCQQKGWTCEVVSP